MKQRLPVHAYPEKSHYLPLRIGQTGCYWRKAPLVDYTLKISDGKTVLYAVSDINGRFTFDNITEGKWVLGLYKGGIPKGYRLEQMFYNVDIKIGEKKEVVYKILPAVR